MPIVAEQYTFVIGVDTHAATHSLALINNLTGAVVDESVFPNTPPGLERALTWIAHRIDGQSALVVIEGVGSYGAGLAFAPVVKSDIGHDRIAGRWARLLAR
jgi:transposase